MGNEARAALAVGGWEGAKRMMPNATTATTISTPATITSRDLMLSSLPDKAIVPARSC